MMKFIISLVVVALCVGGFTLKAASASSVAMQKSISKIEAAEAAALR